MGFHVELYKRFDEYAHSYCLLSRKKKEAWNNLSFYDFILIMHSS